MNHLVVKFLNHPVVYKTFFNSFVLILFLLQLVNVQATTQENRLKDIAAKAEAQKQEVKLIMPPRFV